MADPPDAAAADEALRLEVEGWARAVDALARQRALTAARREELARLRGGGGLVDGVLEATVGSGAFHRAGTTARALARFRSDGGGDRGPGSAAAEVRAARRRRRDAERRLDRARRDVARLTWRVRMRRLGRALRPRLPGPLAPPLLASLRAAATPRKAGAVATPVTWIVHGTRAELAADRLTRRARTREASLRIVEAPGGPAAALERARREQGLVLVSRPVGGRAPDWISRLAAELEGSGADVVAPVVHAGGRAVAGGRRFTWADGRPELALVTQPGPVPAADGACLLARAEALAALPSACPHGLTSDVWGVEATLALTASGREVRLADVTVEAPRPSWSPDDEHALLGRWGPWLRRREAGQAPPSYALRVAAPTWEAAEQGGDLQLARALAQALERAGHETQLEITGAPSAAAACCDVLVALRGRHPFAPRPGQASVLWIISHPSEVSPEEIAGADLVLAASRPHAAALAAVHATPVHPLLQFTDTGRFRPQPGTGRRHGVLFVGNWRSRLRPAVWHALRSGADVALYGRGWEVIAPRRTVAQWVDNADLPRLYSSCDVLLNDHWPDMRALGYLSNRLFDALACGAPVLSDAVEGLEEELGDAVETYADGPALRRRLAAGTADDPERAARAERARRLVETRHGADARAAELLELTLPLAADRHADFACIPATPGGAVIDPPMLSE